MTMNEHSLTNRQLIARFRLSTAIVSASLAVFGLSVQPSLAQIEAFGEEVDEENSEILFEADTVTRLSDEGAIVAEGDVRAFFGERYLRADSLTFDPATNVVTAEGNVVITDENLETVFAGKVILSGDLRDGIVENFSALLEENARIAAQNAVQEQGARTRLSRAVYTACNVCDSEGNAKTPTWRIKALRVTRDMERKVVRFHHAFLELKGVPILYTPFLQGPDPSVERQSGFLTPRVGASSRLGFNLELPYYLALSNSQDATFSPRYTAEDGVLWRGEYRRRGTRSYHVLDGGVINFDNTNEQEEDIPGVRWHYFGRGYRDIGDKWRAKYDFERVSDDDYLRQYDVERRGDLRQVLNRGRTNQLRSNANITRTGENSRLSVDTFLFQGLRPQDDASTTPYILPLIDFAYRPKAKIAGGKSQLNANIASIYRSGGTDVQRFTGSAQWERETITPRGHRFAVFGDIRGDVYSYQDLDQGTEVCSDPNAACAADFPFLNGPETSRVETRVAPTAGVEWSLPMARSLGNARLFLEPRVQLIASPKNVRDAALINEDSQSIEFDYASLFDVNKATGFDTFEDGQRANLGVQASIEWPNGLAIETTLGRQYRLQSTDAFDFSSGLGETSSDVVGSVDFRYGSNIGFENRFPI